ncbi:DUF4236 domain-containing protein [Ureibacillus composti]
MGLRFRKSFKIAPGVRLNVGKKSTGISFGGKGMRYSINSSGRRTASIGIPGTGLSYVSTNSSGRSYKTKAYQTNQRLKNLDIEIQKEQEIERAKYEVELFENQCDLVKSIHKEYDDEVDWSSLISSSPPFQLGEMGPREKEAISKYENYKPKFFERLFKRSEKVQTQLAQQIEIAKAEDQVEYKEWEDLVEIANKVLAGDIEAYFHVLEEMNPLGDLSEFGSGFTFSTDEPSYMEVEFDVHSDQLIPKDEKKLTKTGKLSIKPMTKTRYFELQQDYVCSCILRIARDLFAMLPLDLVIIHAYDEFLNTQTGHEERKLIVSIKIERTILNTLNFDSIDCSDSMNNFPHNMKFLKTKGFASVEKFPNT